MPTRPQLTPCIICEKAVMYLWENDATNLNGGVDITLSAHYGSEFDTSKFAGIVCDECLDRLIQSKRLRFTGYNQSL